VGIAAAVLLKTSIPGQAQTTTRISVNSAGEQTSNPNNPAANLASNHGVISADGRFVAFSSSAANLIPDGNDNNLRSDIFVHDRQTGQTTRVSVSSNGTESNGDSYRPAISRNGRFVAFESFATNLVENDNNQHADIFLHNRSTGQTILVSVSSNGTQGNGDSLEPAISDNGRVIAFESIASNLVNGDLNESFDIFVRDLTNGQTRRISTAANRRSSNGHSLEPSISGDGRIVVFTSFASDLVANDNNQASDVFLHNRATGQNRLVSTNSAGVQGNAGSFNPAIAANAGVLVFASAATNLVENDNNNRDDVFLRVDDGQTILMSVNAAGLQGNGNSFRPAISPNGRFMAFASDADNLVPGDTNQRTDVFVINPTGEIRRASVRGVNNQANGASDIPASAHVLSRSPVFVVFESDATDLVENDSNQSTDVFGRGPF